MRSCPLCRSAQHKLFIKVDAHLLLRCKRCGFVFHGNPPELADEQQKYERYFSAPLIGEYRRDSSNADLRRLWHINQRRLEFIKSCAHGERLLDVGCGRGYFLHHARSFGFHPHGIDISSTAARYAAEQFGLSVNIADIEMQPIEGSFDVITLWHVLEHFHEPIRALQTLRQLLPRSGILIIEVPNLNDLKFRLAPPAYRWRGGNHPRLHRSFFTSKTLAFALNRAGFRCRFYNPRYPAPFLKTALKGILNRFNLDSFLNVIAFPMP
ncbi:MAG: class I SAM-dependent methyltransferase [candidate division KSB1 bacterium]|nr:class I SAM-dependent methyltransferase [candidate division KSB1 bacterium]